MAEILMVEKSSSSASRQLVGALAEHGHQVTVARTPEVAGRWLRERRFRLMLVDPSAEPSSWRTTIERARALSPGLPVVAYDPRSDPAVSERLARLEVTEVVGLEELLDRLPEVIEHYLGQGRVHEADRGSGPSAGGPSQGPGGERAATGDRGA